MYNKVLAPLDGSKLSECSLGHIKEIASGCHVTEVILLTILEQPHTFIPLYGGEGQIRDTYKKQVQEQEQFKEIAEKYLTGASESLKKQGIAVRTVVIEVEANQSAAEAILNYADSNNIDLIIMSTHGRSGITRWAFGSVAERVVRHSRTPVLTIAPTGCRERTD